MNHRIPLLLLLCAPFATACMQELNSGAASGGLRQPPEPDSGAAAPVVEAGPAPMAEAAVDTDAAPPDQPPCPPGIVEYSLDPLGIIVCGQANGDPPVVTDTPPIQTPDGSTNDPCVQTSGQALVIRQRYCAQCHNAPAAFGNFSFVLDDNQLTSTKSPTFTDDAGNHLQYIVPGDTDNSLLYQRVVHTMANPQGQMPPTGSPAPGIPLNARPSVSEISVLRTWIETCLPTGDDGGAGDDGGPTGSGGGSVDAGRPRDAGRG
jgi:hypothetical protein